MTSQPTTEAVCAREDGTHCEHWWDNSSPYCGCGDDTHDGTEEDHGERTSPPVEGALEEARYVTSEPAENRDAFISAMFHDGGVHTIDRKYDGGGQTLALTWSKEYADEVVAALNAAARSRHDGPHRGPRRVRPRSRRAPRDGATYWTPAGADRGGPCALPGG